MYVFIIVGIITLITDVILYFGIKDVKPVVHKIIEIKEDGEEERRGSIIV
jgi:hypothetical protein